MNPTPYPAQDEREVISSYSAPYCEDGYGFGYVDGTCIQSLRGYRDHLEGIIDSIPGEPLMSVAQHERIVAALTRPAQTEQPEHFDDRAVDLFAAAMKAKLAKARKKGRGGWFDRLRCSEKSLARMLIEHLSKGNEGTFEDVASFAMMLHQRGEDPQVLAEAAEAPIKKARGEALELGVRALEAQAEQPEQSADIVLNPEAQKVLTDCIGAHAYVVATITNGHPDLALAEASKWVESFREASAALSTPQTGSPEGLLRSAQGGAE